MILIVGLGNPGKKFEKTRHNLGFIVIDQLSKDNNFPAWKAGENTKCLYSKKMINNKDIELVKPLTYMNNSGKVVKYIAKEYNLRPKNIIVVHDDIDIPLGEIRIVKNRSAAGHRGVQSIIDELGTKDFIRFRIGIKPSEKQKGLREKILFFPFRYRLGGKIEKLEEFVLKKFTKDEEKIIKEVIKKAVELIEIALKEGIERAMVKIKPSE
jgi:PTH1 family peptidyl-tRNA hydrolase